MRLWEINEGGKRRDDCSDQNYHANTGQRHKSWPDFLIDWRSYDHERAFLFRWEWQAPHDEESLDLDDDGPITWRGDENYRDSELLLFFVFGGKGIFAVVRIDVCRTDEPSIREWLTERFAHLNRNFGNLDGAQ